MWKHEKAPKEGQNKPQLLAARNAAKNNPIEDKKPWTTKDQSELDGLDAEIIQIFDTKIVRQTKKVVDRTLAVIPKMLKDQLRILRNTISSIP